DHCREKMDLLAQKAQEISAVYQQLFASIKEAFNLQESSLSAPDIAARIHLEQQKLENESFVLKQEISAIERQISEDNNIEISADPRLLERDFLTQQGYRIASSLTTCAERSEELAQAVDAVRQKIPKSFDCNDTAIHLRTEIAHQIETLSQNAETAKTEFLAASSQKERLEEQIQWLQSSISEELTRKETETAAFNAAVLEAGYSQYTDYLFEKEQLSILPSLEKSTKEYENNLQKYKTLNDQLISDVGGKAPYPLEEMELLFQSLSAELTDTETHYLKAETSLQQHQSVLHYLKKNLSSLQRVDEQYRTVGTLYRLANGNNNVNLSFERFILGGFFDEIIENANQRLQVLSSGRYSVNRKQNKEKGRRASGLDLEVLDIHTGKYRDTNTLSGGESFMTSLALALAVADIISATSGGVTIDTMFIDEGFGSLDSESLETAVDCLLTLRKSNRLIGIISHVSMLSDYIPIKLRIVSSPNGSSIELCSE
ncbi:MAG: SbcC/MukB-like Walker B domain-containing protein, partial [Oscillospiraceae bacterium]